MEKNKKIIRISKQKAIQIIKDLPKERKQIHCFMSFIGADWDRKSVIEGIKKCKKVAWAWNVFNHNLAIKNEKGVQCNFDIPHRLLKN